MCYFGICTRASKSAPNAVAHQPLAAIRSVDLKRTGPAALDDGSDHLDRELGHWEAEINRVKRDSLPALARLHRALLEGKPEPCPSGGALGVNIV